MSESKPEKMRADIAAELKPLFEEAKRKKLWFCCPYYGLWLSPSELCKHQEAGTYRWGAVNWRLADPMDRRKQIDHEISVLQAEKAAFVKRIVAEDFQ